MSEVTREEGGGQAAERADHRRHSLVTSPGDERGLEARHSEANGGGGTCELVRATARCDERSPRHTVGLWPQKAGQKRLRGDVRRTCSATGCRRVTRWFCLTCDADGPVPICAPWTGGSCFADHATDGDGAGHVLTNQCAAACMVCGRNNASRCSCGAAICTVAKGGTGAYGRCYRSHLRENGALEVQRPADGPIRGRSRGGTARPEEGPARSWAPSSGAGVLLCQPLCGAGRLETRNDARPLSCSLKRGRG